MCPVRGAAEGAASSCVWVVRWAGRWLKSIIHRHLKAALHEMAFISCRQMILRLRGRPIQKRTTFRRFRFRAASTRNGILMLLRVPTKSETCWPSRAVRLALHPTTCCVRTPSTRALMSIRLAVIALLATAAHGSSLERRARPLLLRGGSLQEHKLGAAPSVEAGSRALSGFDAAVEAEAELLASTVDETSTEEAAHQKAIWATMWYAGHPSLPSLALHLHRVS